MKSLEDWAVSCIRCGFCLEDCPTYKLTGNELESPRGRIYLARSAEVGKLDWSEVAPYIDHCLGCLACETACPSGVHYGAILELARERLNEARPQPAKKQVIQLTTSRPMLAAALAAGRIVPGKRMPDFMSRFISGVPAEADLPRAQRGHLPPLKQADLPKIEGSVYFLEGCAMKLLFSRVHDASKRLLRRAGYRIESVSQGCCGSMHAHNGFLDEARTLARGLIQAMSEDLPLVINSAGCGSTITHYDELVGDEGAFLAHRAIDISSFLVKSKLMDRLGDATGLKGVKVAYHDACHLAHGQKSKADPRTLLGALPGIELIPLPESDTCCGSAGVYNVLQPKTARELLERKVKNIESTGAEVVALGNPGCHAWIDQGVRERLKGRVTVLHTAEAVEAAFIGLDRFRR